MTVAVGGKHCSRTTLHVVVSDAHVTAGPVPPLSRATAAQLCCHFLSPGQCLGEQLLQPICGARPVLPVVGSGVHCGAWQLVCSRVAGVPRNSLPTVPALPSAGALPALGCFAALHSVARLDLEGSVWPFEMSQTSSCLAGVVSSVSAVCRPLKRCLSWRMGAFTPVWMVLLTEKFLLVLFWWGQG